MSVRTTTNPPTTEIRVIEGLRALKGTEDSPPYQRFRLRWAVTDPTSALHSSAGQTPQDL
jgi:hypothetical protein